jgi:DHA1 family tetracycline resistance protein-like MFS transporter
MLKHKKNPAATAFILLTVMLDTIGIGLLIPGGPRFVASFVGNDLGHASHYFGALIALYAFMQFLFAPGLGRAKRCCQCSRVHGLARRHRS